MSISPAPGAHVERSSGAALADAVGLILDKGLVIDAFVRVSLAGIEVINIDARIVVASVETYLRFAEAANRLDLYERGGRGLPEVLEGTAEAGARGVARGKPRGMVEGARESLAPRREEESRRPIRRERDT